MPESSGSTESPDGYPKGVIRAAAFEKSNAVYGSADGDTETSAPDA